MSRQLRYGDAEEAGMSAPRVQTIRRLGAEWVERGQAAALSMLVARRSVVVLHEAYGRLGPEPDAPPLLLDAVYPLASATKPITATCAMCLVEHGLLGLNRPVLEYVPELTGDRKDAVMVHHLLAHTSGITPESVGAHAETKLERGELGGLDGPGISVLPLGVRVDPRLYDVRLAVPPGSEMSYCNLNYTLLAEIVGRVAASATARFAQERVFEPLGMVDACSVGVDPTRLPRFIRRPVDNPFAFLNEVDLVRCFPGAASATATAWDMAVFGLMFLNGGRYGALRILSAASVAAMSWDQIPGVGAVSGTERFNQAGWGYGWNIKVDKQEVNGSGLVSRRMYEHSGAGGASVRVDPEYELVPVYLSVETSGEMGGKQRWCMDHFADAAISAIDD